MQKLIKYLKPFIIAVLGIIALLLVQAICDLMLPDYTSHIVNVGIQQGGVENAVPAAIRKSEFDKLVLFMDEAGKVKVMQDYTLLDGKSLSQKEYVKDYPLLVKEPIYKLNTANSKEKDELNLIMGKAIVAVSGIEKQGMVIPASQTQLETIKKKMDEKLAAMSGSMITQAAVSYIQSEYKVLGINTDKMQSNYILHIGALMLLVTLLSMVSTVVVSYLASRVSAGLGRDLEKMFSKRWSPFPILSWTNFLQLH